MYYQRSRRNQREDSRSRSQRASPFFGESDARSRSGSRPPPPKSSPPPLPKEFENSQFIAAAPKSTPTETTTPDDKDKLRNEEIEALLDDLRTRTKEATTTPAAVEN